MSQFLDGYQTHAMRVQKALGITDDQYNLMRRYVSALQVVYEEIQQFTGEDEVFSKRIEDFAKELNLFVFYRFTSINVQVYLSKEKIDETNFESGQLI